MKDLQKLKPRVEIEINKVGIKDLLLPFKIKFNGKLNPIIAKTAAFVDLPKTKRGTHMSRIVRILNEASSKKIDIPVIRSILQQLKEELSAKHTYLQMEFVLFKEKKSPITKNKGYISYKCFINSDHNDVFNLRIGTKVLVMSLCPISKEISKNNAHNQRGEIMAELLCKNGNLWFDELIDIVEKSGSCELFSTLKREDEKFLTEKAYENPKIVEDIVREVALKFKKNKNILEFKVSCENFESIHTHNAFSEIRMKNGL